MATKDKKKVKGDKASINPKEWNIVWKDIAELTPYAKNARINDQTVPYLKNSIQRFGFKIPLVIDKDGVIVAGHTRLKAALELGYAKLPCVVADDLTPAEVKAFRLADNKVAEMSTWDYSLLDEEMKELGDDGFGDMADFGFANFGGDAELGGGTGGTSSGTGGGTLPPELAGQDLEPEKLPDAGGEAATCSRIIITFDESERTKLATLLGVKELDPSLVMYTVAKLEELRAIASANADGVAVDNGGDAE